MTDELKQDHIPDTSNMVEALKAENERLQEALEDIALQKVYKGADGLPYSEVDRARNYSVEIAKQALEGK
jgi:hypothetical protein